MKKRIIFGALLLVVLSVVAFVGCAPPQVTVNVPATPVTITAPAATSASPSGLMGDTVQQLIQLQMYKSILTDTSGTNNGGWHGGHHHGD